MCTVWKAIDEMQWRVNRVNGWTSKSVAAHYGYGYGVVAYVHGQCGGSRSS